MQIYDTAFIGNKLDVKALQYCSCAIGEACQVYVRIWKNNKRFYGSRTCDDQREYRRNQ